MFGDPTLNGDQRMVMDIFGRTQRLWFAGDFDPTLASNVDQAALQGLVPLDRGQRVLRPIGANFDNRLPMLLNGGTVRETSITDMVNWNSKNFCVRTSTMSEPSPGSGRSRDHLPGRVPEFREVQEVQGSKGSKTGLNGLGPANINHPNRTEPRP